MCTDIRRLIFSMDFREEHHRVSGMSLQVCVRLHALSSELGGFSWWWRQ